MKKMLSILIVLLATAAVACGGGGDSAADSDSLGSGLAPTATPAGGPLGDFGTAFRESTAPEETAPPSGGVLTRMWDDPTTLDPHLTGDVDSAFIIVEVFSGLVAYNTDLELIPDIAEKIDVEDGRVYTFTLRPNVRFHNGRPVTAEDFKWSLERAANPKTASPVADTYLNDIVGAVDYMDGKASEISGIKAIDKRTLQITVDGPKAYFLAKMTYPTAYVLDREVVEAGGRDWWVENPVGTGPFKLKEYRLGERIILERNDDYYREPAKLSRIHMRLAGGQGMALYENDEIDITGVGLFDVDRVLDPDSPLNRDVVVAPPSFSVSYVGINPNEPPFDDVKFRQALNHAVDKELIASQVLADLVVPAYGILPPEFPGFNPDLRGLRYDPILAQQLLSQTPYAGFLARVDEDSFFYDSAQRFLNESPFADSKRLPRIEVTIPGTGGSPGLSLEVVTEMWRQVLGVDVDTPQVEWATYLKDLDRKQYQAFSGLAWIADYPDPQDFLDILFHSESSINHGGYSNPEVDAVLEDARVEQDPVRRISLYNQAEEMIINDAAWVPLWFSGDQYVLIKPHVKGYKLTPMIVPKHAQVSIE